MNSFTHWLPPNNNLQRVIAFSIFLSLFLCIAEVSNGQGPASPLPKNFFIKDIQGADGDLYGTRTRFIKNIGQYGDTIENYGRMGRILFGYEGLDMPVLFTPKGLIHLQRKFEGPSEEEKEEREHKDKIGKHAEEIEEGQKVIDRIITMEWLNANPNPQVIAEDQLQGYHTYGGVQGMATTYKKIIYKEVYPGIDIEYSFTQNKKAGFEYGLIVKPGTNLSVVKMRYDGDVKSIKQKKDGSLIIKSDIDGIAETVPVCFYREDKTFKSNVKKIKSDFAVNNKEIGFSFPESYDATKAIVIDPFVTATSNLTGVNAGKAKDVDFDYAGNIYVTGGGSGVTTHQLAKFNAAGILQWTFNGTLTIPSWTFGTYWGGWMVEKPTGNVYLGQGFNPVTGFQVIRVSSTGLYDNYITTANPNFREAWKMLWNCNNGLPQILVAGGGTNSNINFGVFTPPSTNIGSLNVTGIPYTGADGWAQDIVDFIIDPANNDMYTLYGSLFGTPSLTNKIYKNTAPYSGASVAWNVPSGFTSVEEISNRPYLLGPAIDNSANIFAINGSYLYYWDGKNLKALDKATGNGVGTPLVTANTTLMQGGIIADACNNVFVGDGNGVIKVYKFNGSVFDDAAAPDISIPGFAGKSVYDLAYDESKKLLYASGDGFIASFDISPYCPTTRYTLNVVPDCLTASATVTVNPTPPAGSTITYVLSAGATQIATNTTGVFTGLRPNVNYTVVATINLACSGTQATTTFVLPGPTISITSTNTTCGNSTGTITATGSGTTAPYTYSIDGTNFQASGNFTGLAGGVDTITGKDANGCKSTKVVTILNSNGPVLSYTNTNADCGNNNGTITASATGGTVPYQYSINGTIYQSSNFFTGILPGPYILTARDANGCTNATLVTVTSSPKPLINAIPAAATCGSSNGTITSFGSGGTPPLEYSINGNIFQAGNVFTNLTPGTYIVRVRDVNSCANTTTVTIDNSPAPTVTAISTPAACNNINGTITATGNNGIAPLQYSINGITFQSSNIFSGLAAGTYTITIEDATGCTNITTVVITATGGPTVTATSTASACNTNNGTITATAGGGIPGYQYSIDGTTFQASNIFTALIAGKYVVYIQDVSGCTGTFTIVVSNTAGPSITAASTPTACNTNNGTVTATGTGGISPLQYSLDGTTYQLNNVFTGLTTGIYTADVKDANGCITTTTVNVVNASGLSLDASTISSSCFNGGIITATATGGISPLRYSINGTVYQAGNTFNGLVPGTYMLYAKDANNCVVTKPAIVSNASTLTLTATVPLQATCGSASGVIMASGSGGTQPLQYSIDGVTFQPGGVFINVAPGTYTILLKDASGCTATQSVIITTSGSGNAITDVTFTAVDVFACSGDLGRIKNLKGVPGGGGNSYTFSLDFGPFTASNQFTGVNIGTHIITAKNQDGCTVTRLVTIGTGVLATATATATGTACNTANGSITITGVGANTPFHASFDNGITWITFDPSFTFTGLAPGTYNIVIADDAGFDDGPPIDPGNCLTTISVIVPSIGGPSIVTTQINGTCTSNTGSINATGGGGTPPYTYNINGGPYFAGGVFNNLTPGVYAVTVKDATGCINGTAVTLTNPAGPTVTAATQSASCNLNNGTITATGIGGTTPLEYSVNGTTFQSSSIFTNLAAGSYILYVGDANGCFGTVPVLIDNTRLPAVTAFTIAATCNNDDGSIVAEGSFGSAPYTFSVNGTVYQSSNTFSGLAAGFYTVYLQDARGCITTTGVSVGNTVAPSIVNIVTTPANCGNATGSITVTASGASAPLQYSIDEINFQTVNIFTALLPGNYTVIVKDVNGCLATKTISVNNNNGPQALTAVITNAVCGLNNGTITATAPGGTAPLVYSIDGITYQASNIFNSIATNIYTLYVKDINGCIKTLPVTVLNLPGPTLALNSSPASCGLNDGTITVHATGGTDVLTYSKDGVTFQGSNIFLGSATGPYTITVKDARGCTNTSDITVTTIGITMTPIFTPVGNICSGSLLAALPTTSLNSITGTWAPALNNTATTSYTFTPTAGQCATTTTLTITVNPNITPSFNAVAPICAGATLTPLPTTSLNGITGTWTPVLNNTATTTYTFTPTAGQCATTTTLTITVNPNITPSFNAVAPICTGATLTPLPTTSLNGITGTWTPVLNNTATTTYTFTPTIGQCAATTTLTITVNSLPLSPTVTVTQPTCTVATGTITITSATAGLSFSLDGALYSIYPLGGYSATAQGSHTITAQNVSGCISAITNVTVNAGPIPISAILITASNTTCGTTDGTLTLGTVTGGTPPYLYSVDGSSFAATLIYANLAAGAHTIIVKDANGCSFTSNITITNTNGATVTAAAVNTTCGAVNGSITVTGTGGVAPYQYSINGTTFQAGNVFNALAGGPYTVTVKDVNNCINTTSVIVGNSTGVTATATSVAASCGASNGSVTVTSTGGNTPYQYSINGTTFQASNIFTNLTANNYTVIIKDANNCTNTTTVTIASTSGATVTATVVNASCGAGNGSITATGAGGVSPYQYSVNGTTFQASNIFTNLTANNYTVTIKDANNCTNTTTVTIASISGATVTATVANASCGAGNGSITATGAGGESPYQYSINGTTFQASNIFTNLTANNYTVTIKDANNCTNTTTVTIASTSGPTVTATVTNASCGNANGSLTATAAGSTPPYQYSIDGINFQSSNVFNGLTSNTYSVTIKDAGNCTNTTTVTITNSNGATVTAVGTNATCGNANGKITAAGVGGTTPYQYSIDGITFQNSNIFIGLAANTYTVTIRDAKNCSNTTSVTVTNVTGPSVTATGTTADCTNNNGSATASGTGGTLPYQYSINGNVFQPGNVFTGLAANTYTIIIKDANGCTNSTSVIVAINTPVTVNAGLDVTICEGTSKELAVISDGTTFSWSPATGLSNISILNPVASPVITTTYVLTATSGQCSKSDTVTVFVNHAPAANAGNDATICFGKNILLSGGGGSIYQWAPSTYLSNTSISDPVVVSPPSGTLVYLLNVTDAEGCKSLKSDTVIITVLPPAKVFAGRDTSITINQPLQLNAIDVNHIGFTSYTWSPSFGLNNNLRKNPVAIVSQGITYTVTARTADGCEAIDNINITVFVKPELYVPTGFTPNGDGLNDVIKVIPVGIKELEYFSIYNRWGELVFTTSDPSKGWNGIYKGQSQNTSLFVWIAEGIDYKGNILQRKGTVTLIR